MAACTECGKETTNPKFCSRSCSTRYANSRSPKRSPMIKSCPTCEGEFIGRRLYCSPSCAYPDMQLREAIYHKHHRSSAYALVRTRARALAKNWGMSSCAVCGYDRHVEITHIKAISSFSEDTLISVINSRENLRPLCPNHHWEHDHPLAVPH